MRIKLVDMQGDFERVNAFLLARAKEILYEALLVQIQEASIGNERTRCTFPWTSKDSPLLYRAEQEDWIEVVTGEGQKPNLFLLTPKGVDALLGPSSDFEALARAHDLSVVGGAS